VAPPVGGQYLGEVIAPHQLREGGQALTYDEFRACRALLSLPHRGRHEPLDHARERSAIRLCPRGHVPHQFGVEGTGLASGCLKPPVWSEVRVKGHGLFFKSDGPHQVQEEGLASAIGADDEADAGAAVCDPVDVAQERLDLFGAANLNVVEP